MADETLPDHLPYPEDLDPPDIPQDFKDLAIAVQAALNAVGLRSFGSAAVRDAEISSPRSGQFAWLEDSERLVVYSGGQWKILAIAEQPG